jgi:hypothetical protein
MRRSSKHTRSFQDHHCIVQVSSRGDLRHQDPADGASGRSKKKTQDQVQGRSTTTDAAGREDDGDELLLPARSCARQPMGTSSVRGHPVESATEGVVAGRERGVRGRRNLVEDDAGASLRTMGTGTPRPAVAGSGP